MARDQLGAWQEVPEVGVLPFRSGEGRVPSIVLVRQALESIGAVRDLVRGGMAVAAAVGERGASESFAIASGSIGITELVERSGLTAGEVSRSLLVLREAGVLAVRADRLRLDPDLYCTLPALAEVDWPGARRAIGRMQGRVAPALALLRELARRSRRGADGEGEWLQPVVQELMEETLYGRTAVIQAVSDLVRAALLLKANLPARSGLRVRLTVGAFVEEAAAEAVVPRSKPEMGSRGIQVEIGGAIIGVPPGGRLELPAGMNYRLEIAPDGRAIIRVDE